MMLQISRVGYLKLIYVEPLVLVLILMIGCYVICCCELLMW